jgi:hypothetical protein
VIKDFARMVGRVMKLQKTLVIVASTLVIAYCAIPVASSFLHRDDWKKNTTPLPKETISILCRNLALDNSNPLCNGTKSVLASDFSEAIREYFPLKDSHRTPKNEATITNQEVDAVLGQFKLGCQDVEHFPASGYSSFRCFYDLRGDNYWRYVFYFYYPEETLYSIRSGSSGDD